MTRVTRTQVAYGRNPALINIANEPISANSDPSNSDRLELNRLWSNYTTNGVFMLTSYVAGNPIWTRLDGGPVPTGLTWATDGGVGPVALDSNYGYRLQNVGVINTVLPVNSVVGDQIWLTTDNSAAALAGITIDVGAAQSITFGDRVTSPGAGTKLLATHPGAVASGRLSISIILVCTADNTTWNVFSANVVPNLI